MTHDPQRQFFQALGETGTNIENPGGITDTYRETIQQTIKGRIRLHHVYDGGPDGIQIAGWNNGTAEAILKQTFEGTEQRKSILREKTTTYDGPAAFEGDEYEPSFQIWIYPDEEVYSIEYRLAPVRALKVERCRMEKGMEDDRKRLEHVTDADIPLGGFFSGLTRVACATEKRSKVDIDGGAMSGMVVNEPLPEKRLVLEGEGESQFADMKGVKMRWSCRPE